MYQRNGKTTDKLILEEKEITDNPVAREHDVLVSTGEQITIAKLSMLLNKKGYKAESLTGWQIPIITDSNFGNSRIKFINNDTILKMFDEGKIVVIAGFQGVDEEGRITTFGRGGSDTTAVALAASLKADRCDIFTDVDGVFVTDPRIIDNPKKMDKICYEEMLEMASSGAKVLHNRCVEIAKKYNIPINVKSTFEEEPKGTVVSNEQPLEDMVINGIAKDDYITRVTIIGLDNKIGKTYELFDLLASNNINVDVIMQALGETYSKNVTFTIKTSELDRTIKLLKENQSKLNFKDLAHSDNLSKVSIIGVGIANKPGVASSMFQAFAEANINMHMITTSEIKIAVLVANEDAEKAVKALYKKFF